MKLGRGRQRPQQPLHRYTLEELIGFGFLALALQIEHVKEVLMSELDDATQRIVNDIDNAVAAIADLRAAIDALGNTGADVTALNAAADKLEAALTPPTA